VKFNGLMD